MANAPTELMVDSYHVGAPSYGEMRIHNALMLNAYVGKANLLAQARIIALLEQQAEKLATDLPQ